MVNLSVGPQSIRSLRLFDCWELRAGDRQIRLGAREQRLITFAALHGKRLRSYMAGVLWPDSTEHHAQSSLRAALFLVNRDVPSLLDSDRTTIDLAPDVQVDVQDFRQCVTDVMAHPDEVDVGTTIRTLIGGDLIPGWYDDWVLFERESLHHERVRALETLALAELNRGRARTAATAARAAMAIEPLRETPRWIEIRAHLFDGNVADAVHVYQSYARLLRCELGIDPSESLRSLVSSSTSPHLLESASGM